MPKKKKTSAKSPIDALFEGQPAETVALLREHKALERERSRKEFMDKLTNGSNNRF